MRSANTAKTSGERAIERLAASGTACPKSRTSVYVGFCSSRTFLAIHLNIALTKPRRNLCYRLTSNYATLKTEHEPQRRRANRTPSLTISTSDCAVLLRSRRTKRGGIMSERHLSMRVLSVVPRHAVTVGSLLRGNGDVGATRKAIRPVDGL